MICLFRLQKPSSSFTPSAPPFQAPAPPHVPVYATMPPPPSHTTAYPPPTSTPYSFPPSPFPSYPPSSVAYQTSMYSPYPSGYPPSSYPPPPLAYPPTPYPPPPQASPFYPPGRFTPTSTLCYMINSQCKLKLYSVSVFLVRSLPWSLPPTTVLKSKGWL